MQKVIILLIAIASAAVGYKYWSATTSQKSGPFAEFEIDLTSHALTDRSLEALNSKVEKMADGIESKKFLESIDFTCKIDLSKKDDMRKLGYLFDFRSVIICEYQYGFFNEKIVVWIYLDKIGEKIRVETRNLYFEV